MNIAFNMLHCGLGNNGGTRTVILSAQTLEKLGHTCDIISNVDNFTWFGHKPIIRHAPKGLDVVINAAAVDYESTRRLDVPIKIAWWRGHEIWANSEEYLSYCYTDEEVKNIANSEGLRRLIEGYGSEAAVVYQGIDFELWKNRNLRPKNKIRIGCLYQQKKTKRWEDFISLSKVLGAEDYEYVGIGMSKRKDSFLTNFWYKASVEELNNIYSSCHIWFAPTELEGLHNVPIEASLCGCLVVANDVRTNGMVLDYVNDDTAMVYKARDIEHAGSLIKNPEWNKVSNMQTLIKTKIGNRKYNMSKFVEMLHDNN